MAHVKKIKQDAVAPLVAHYERQAELERGFRRDNIDPNRTSLNYNLRPTDVRQEVGRAIARHEETAGKGIRKDANVLCDWVVTLPQDCPRERSREFFEAVASFMEGRYGVGNVLGCYVHLDETTPHAHIPILPMRDGKLVASKVINRADLKTFHGELGKAVDTALGYHVSVELTEEQRGERAGKYVGLSEYKAAQNALEATKAELADIEAMRAAAIAEAAAEAEQVSEAEAKIGKLNSKLDEMMGESWTYVGRDGVAKTRLGVRGCQDRCKQARDELADLQAEMKAAREELAAARTEYDGLLAAFETLAAEIRDYIREWLTEPYKAFKAWAASYGKESAVEEVEERGRSLAERARGAREAADAWNQNRSGSSSRDRNWGDWER